MIFHSGKTTADPALTNEQPKPFQQLPDLVKVKKKAEKEAEVRSALEIQGKIDDLAQRINGINHLIQQRDDEIAKLKEAKENQVMQKNMLLSEMKSLMSNESYRSQAELKRIHRDIADINNVISSVRKIIDQEVAVDPLQVDLNCPVCSRRPVEVFSCKRGACRQWLCGRCRFRLDKCTICRGSFKEFPPERNLAIERLVSMP